MKVQELHDGLARAVEAAKPAEEFCLRMVEQQWWSCMTKAEWSGWMQAIGALIAILASVLIVSFQMNSAERIKQAAAARRVLSLVAGLNAALDPILALDPAKPLVGDSLCTSAMLVNEWVADARSIAYEDLSLEWMASLQLLRSIGIAIGQELEKAQSYLRMPGISREFNIATVRDLLKILDSRKAELQAQILILRSHIHRPSKRLQAGPK